MRKRIRSVFIVGYILLAVSLLISLTGCESTSNQPENSFEEDDQETNSLQIEQPSSYTESNKKIDEEKVDSQTVSNQEISDYLDIEYFSQCHMTITEIKDVTEYPTEFDNHIQLTCATIATNEYVEQIANWTLEFEYFDGTWVGISNAIGVNECSLISGLTEESLADIWGARNPDNTFLDVGVIETNYSDLTSIVRCSKYEDYGAYCFKQDLDLTYTWDSRTMQWDASAAPQYGDEQILISLDIYGHYEVSTDSRYLSFDLSAAGDQSNSFILQNFYTQFCPAIYWEEVTGEDISFSFSRGTYGNMFGVMSGGSNLVATMKIDDINSDPSDDWSSIKAIFYITDNTLYYISGDRVVSGTYELKTDLNSTTFIEPYFIQGTQPQQ